MSTTAPKRKPSDQLIADAEMYCRKHRLRLTQGRRAVLELLTASPAAVKAYDLLEQLTEPGAKAMPPTVYRALDFWIEHGFVHRIESINAFFACGHPLHNHGCQLLVCTSCGRTVEVCDAELREHYGDVAQRAGFSFQRAILEIHGTCPHCSAST